MKKTILIASVLLNVVLAILVIIPFTSKEEVTKEEVKDTVHKYYSSNTANEVNINAAIDNLENLHNYDTLLRAYTISARDMMQVMGMDTTKKPRYTSCRAYLGLDSLGNFRMFLTPIKDTKDVFFNPSSTLAGPAKSTSYVLDLIAPCPNTCDTQSPLYTFVKPRP